MARAASEITVDAPLKEVYNQWTQFEEFPQFMSNVKQVEQLDDRHLQWHASIGGKDIEWRSEIEEQVPDNKIVWRSVDGAMNAGLVRFDRVSDQETQVHLEMSYEPEGVLQNLGDALGVVDRDVEEDLKRFKSFIEERGRATGGWRGELDNPDAPSGHTRGQGTPDVPDAQ